MKFLLRLFLLGLMAGALYAMDISSDGSVIKDLAFIISHNAPVDHQPEGILRPSLKEGSEMKFALMGLIRMYQIFISSQDKPVCNFTLSCSRFGMTAIQNFGFFHGLLMASDRVQRCNGLGKKYYAQDPETGLAVDLPLDEYFLGPKKRRP